MSGAKSARGDRKKRSRLKSEMRWCVGPRSRLLPTCLAAVRCRTDVITRSIVTPIRCAQQPHFCVPRRSRLITWSNPTDSRCTQKESLCGRRARERALALNVEILDNDPCRFPMRTHPKRNSTRTAGHFSFRLIGEHVAVPVPQRKGVPFWPDQKTKCPVVVHHVEVAEVVIAVRAEVGFRRQWRRLRAFG